MTKSKALHIVCGLLLLAIATHSSQLVGRALEEADCNDPPGSGDPCAYDDANCASWDHSTCECLDCNSHACFNPSSGLCEDVDPNCNGHQCLAAGGEDCTGCYDGYEVVDGECVVAQDPPAGGDCEDPPGSGDDCVNNDAYCHTFNYDACFCEVCSYRTCLNFNTNQCEPVSDHCKEWACGEDGGYCTCCYGGYTLCDGECVMA